MIPSAIYGGGLVRIVITSYSIHYTKLYDIARADGRKPTQQIQTKKREEDEPSPPHGMLIGRLVGDAFRNVGMEVPWLQNTEKQFDLATLLG